MFQNYTTSNKQNRFEYRSSKLNTLGIFLPISVQIFINTYFNTENTFYITLICEVNALIKRSLYHICHNIRSYGGPAHTF